MLSLVVWVNAVYQDDAPRQDYFPQAIAIEVLNTGEGLIVTNAPSQEVNVQIKAFQSSWSSLTAESFRATVDLTGLAEGLHTVPVEVTCTNPTVTILAIQPDSLYVQIDHLNRTEMPVELRLESIEALPLGYSVGTPVFSPATVVVEGPAGLVKNVQVAAVSVSLSVLRESIDQNLPVRALDSAGKQITGVTNHAGCRAHRTGIEQRQNYRR